MLPEQIVSDTTVVFYGDKSNWWACYAFWAFTLFGHKHCKVMNGGRKLWINQGRPLSTEPSQYPATKYVAAGGDEASIRVFREEVLAHAKAGEPLIDVRRPKEFTGELLRMEEYPPGRLVPGQPCPGARVCPATAVNRMERRDYQESIDSTRMRSGSSRPTTSWPTAASASDQR